MTTLPTHPRLATHVMARRYRRDDRSFIVLYDNESGARPQVGERTYALLAGLDGTRDLQGLLAFATQQGVTVTMEELLLLLGELSSAGMLGPAESVQPASVDAEAEGSGSDLPILQLEGFKLSCDGSGTCCRFYPTILFSPLETARARGHLPLVREAGDHPSRVFLPAAGNEPGACAVTLEDGRCSYLEVDGRCGIHRVASEDQKPLGCRTYPARFVSDGSAVRVTPWLECSCVLRSAESPDQDGAALTSKTYASQLPREFAVEPLPEQVQLAMGRYAPRSWLSAQSLRWAAHPVDDAPSACLALARALEAGDSEIYLTMPHAAATKGEITPYLSAMQDRLAKLAAEDFRSPRDMVRITAEALVQAAALGCAAPEEFLQGSPALREVERFYLRTALFGHHLVPRSASRSMAQLLRDRAARILLARALTVVVVLAELRDPAFRYPLALVDATLRGYGVGGYLAELDLPELDA